MKSQKSVLGYKSKSIQGDWYFQVQADVQKFGIPLYEKEIEEKDLTTYKNGIKTSV